VVILYALGRDESVARVSVAAVFLNVLLNVALIPLHGVVGAAVESLYSFVLLGVVTAYYVNDEVRFRPPLREFARVFLAAGAMIAVVYQRDLIVPLTALFTFSLVGIGAALFFFVLPLVSPTIRSDLRWVASNVRKSGGMTPR